MSEQPRRWVIVGAGFTGLTVARQLAGDGATVVVTRREMATAQSSAADIEGVSAAALNLAEPATWSVIKEGDVVVNSVPPGPHSPEAEGQFAAACAARGVFRLVYLSSTGVYPAAGGAKVDESMVGVPHGARGARRLAAESATLEAARVGSLSVAALRISGIYGPGRGVKARLRKGNYRIIGSGTTKVNRIHVDDLARAVVLVGGLDRLPYNVFNVSDDEATPSGEVGDAVADAMGLPRPPRVDVSEVSPDVAAMLGADRDIDNSRLKSLGWTLRYPSWREGMLDDGKAGVN